MGNTSQKEKQEEEDEINGKLRAFRFIVVFVNTVTTVLTLIPLVGAIIALLSEHPKFALQLDVVGLIVFVVTKGVLWLLAALLVPAIKAVPAGIGSGIASYAVQRWLKNREKNREPTKKK